MTTDTLVRPAQAAATATTITRVRIRKLKRKPTAPYTWAVVADDTGETIVERSKDPEFDACRALLAKGVTGTVETYTGDRAFPSFRLDIEKGAGLTIEDGPRMRIRAWRPHFQAGGDDETE